MTALTVLLYKILPAAALAILLAAGFALADDHDRVRELRNTGDILPLEMILEAQQTDYPGRILEVELESEDGRYVYEIEVLQPGGEVIELLYDARTGELIRMERED